MQPYFLPYIGYFQMIKAVDEYVIYDNIEYTKKGWINRNRILQNNKDTYITLPLIKDSDYLNIIDRYVSPDFNKTKLINQIKESYRKAPFFSNIMPVLENVINYEDNNLFNYIYNSIKVLCDYLQIDTKIIISSTLNIDWSLKGQDKVIAICKTLGATEYYNAIGGQDLYSYDDFAVENINLRFLKTQPIEYVQYKNDFIPNLSILDVLMFNSKEETSVMLDKYELI